MHQINIRTTCQKILSDTLTPVSVYLRLRDRFANSLLLESSEYDSRENAFSYLCCHPVASFRVTADTVEIRLPGRQTEQVELTHMRSAIGLLKQFQSAFTPDPGFNEQAHINHGLFGYLAYDGLQYCEDLRLENGALPETAIPEIWYQVYQYVLVFDHFKDELYIYTHHFNAVPPPMTDHQLLSVIRLQNTPVYPFAATGDEIAHTSESQYLENVRTALRHCHRGDVFQIVLSRAFSQHFTGDDFNVYRALRAVNPSPYLFYFDFGDFRLFGSSPEAQLTIRHGEASIHPIAGTYRRTGDPHDDQFLAEQLKTDPKESAEHVMLVDLARNDLSRHAKEVHVKRFAEIQYYSHVIHLVSEVTGRISAEHVVDLMADTFPAGTLSGAPKYRAMEIIDHCEKHLRGFYGGAIGFIGFDGTVNHAIMIRTLCAKDNTLTYQAGAGIVESSLPESELTEIDHKVGALRHAIQAASAI